MDEVKSERTLTHLKAIRRWARKHAVLRLKEFHYRLKVHSVDWENHGRDGHNDSHKCQGFHDIVLDLFEMIEARFCHRVKDVSFKMSAISMACCVTIKGIFVKITPSSDISYYYWFSWSIFLIALICLKWSLKWTIVLINEFNQFFVRVDLKLALNLLTLAIERRAVR